MTTQSNTDLSMRRALGALLAKFDTDYERKILGLFWVRFNDIACHLQDEAFKNFFIEYCEYEPPPSMIQDWWKLHDDMVLNRNSKLSWKQAAVIFMWATRAIRRLDERGGI